MLLSDLQNNEKGIITKVRGRGAFRKRITEMGFVRGKEVLVVRNAPLKDPVEYSIMGYELSLRRSEAELIEVITPAEAEQLIQSGEFSINISNGTITDEVLRTTAVQTEKIINVALVGNPNAGKTTFFNFASGAHEHVGNYSGVTVDAKKARFQLDGYTFNIVDLPGTYSLTAYSPEELYVRKYIMDFVPDIVINVVAASNLERNLYLTTQLIDMDIRVVMALNMYDELRERGDSVDYELLGNMLGMPIVPTVSSKGQGINELFRKAIEVYDDASPTQRQVKINYGKDVEVILNQLTQSIATEGNRWITDTISARFMAIKLIEKDKEATALVQKCNNATKIKQQAANGIKQIETTFEEDSETVIADAKYGFIHGAIRETYTEGTIGKNKRTETIDTFLTHKLFGFPIFIAFIWLMFQSTFTIGSYPMNWIDNAILWGSNLLQNTMPNGMLKDLLIDGIIGGVGGVIIFLPNILILFFFISLMEDTGYMARAAFIMDKLMHKIGLHGKSFIPLIMGFGCNVPAIMATRTLDNRNDRLLTMLINPFMSCSARLPVYILIIGAFFPNNSGTILFAIYFTGILLAVAMALIFKRVFFKTKQAPFVMELPPYRVPTMRSTLRHMWNKGREYLKKMGGVILVASIIIWALGYFPRNVEYSTNYDELLKTANWHKEIMLTQAGLTDRTAIQQIEDDYNTKKQSIELDRLSERQAKSYIGQIGMAIEPVLKPLGFDWKMSVSLLTGMAAKEIVISTMGVLYNADAEADESSESLKEVLRKQTHQGGELDGQIVFTPAVAFAFMLFVLIYFPCVAVVAAIRRESGHWKWALFTMVYTTALAWIAAFLAYRIGSLFC